jgi:hypothetical protein
MGESMKRAFAIPLVLALTGCESLFGICETNGISAIGVVIVDSLTQGPVVADTIWGRARDGSYVDSVLFSTIGRTEPITSLPFATEREGVYDVLIGASGYRTWERRGVRVRDGGCHVKPVSLTAKLQRIS